MDNFEIARQQMVLSQLKPHHVHDESVLSAFFAIPRHLFVPEAQKNYAYRDGIVSIRKNEYLLSPATLGRLLQEMALTQGGRVLLLNSTTGYTAALLMHLGAQVDIYETDQKFIAKSEAIFKDLSLNSYRIIDKNPLQENNSPMQYAAIFVAGGTEVIPPFVLECLQEQGKFIGILCDTQIDHAVCLQRVGGGLQKTVLFETKVPCLVSFKKEDAVEL